MRLVMWMMTLIAVGMSSSAYAAPEDWKSTSATVNFVVNVLPKQCTVEIGPNPLTDNKMYLGAFPGKPGTVGPSVPVAFRFKECKGATMIQSIKFSRDIGALNGGNPGSVPGGPDQGFVSTNLTKVRIFLTEDSASTIPFRSKKFNPAETINPATWVPVCYAQARVVDVDGDGVPAPARTFEGQAEFIVEYN